MPFDQSVADYVCSEIAQGRSLRDISKDNNVPSGFTIHKWLRNNKDFAQQYVRAREEQADRFADEIVAIADDESLEPHDRRIRIDARKWAAGKLKPKVYGERVSIQGDRDADPIQTEELGTASLKLASLIETVAARIPPDNQSDDMIDITPSNQEDGEALDHKD